MSVDERREIVRKRLEQRKRHEQYQVNPYTKPKKLRKGEPYCERHETLINHAIPSNVDVEFSKCVDKSICYECRTIYNWKAEKCSACGSEDVLRIGPIARIPRKNASKKKWEEFWNHCGKSCAGGCR